MIRDLPEAVRAAGEAALLMSTAIETGTAWSMPVMETYGSRIRPLDEWDAPADVARLMRHPKGDRVARAVAAHVGEMLGALLGEVIAAHTLAVTVLADVSNQSREAVVADLIERANDDG